MTCHNTSREARQSAEATKAGCRAIINAAIMPDAAKATLILEVEECVDEAFHNEIADLEYDEAYRKACIYQRELADMRHPDRGYV